jgi:hypothetical protein
MLEITGDLCASRPTELIYASRFAGNRCWDPAFGARRAYGFPRRNVVREPRLVSDVVANHASA